MKYSLATVRLDGAATPVIEVRGQYWSLSDTDFAEIVAPGRQGLLGLFDDWAGSHRRLEGLADQLAAGKGPAPVARSDAALEFLAPLQYPGKVLCTGLNYKDHQEETGLVFKKEDHNPPMFLKPPRTTLVGCGKSLRFPPQTEKLDWELELAAVIARPTRGVRVDEAMDYVAASMVGADMSARDRQFDPRNMASQDTIGGKCFDGSCPVGPRFVPAQFVADPQDLDMELTVNGEVEISSNTGKMIWSIAEQVAEAARHMTLEPGDILLTGCPAGVGLSKNKFLKVGDKLELRIGDLGCLAFEIV